MPSPLVREHLLQTDPRPRVWVCETRGGGGRVEVRMNSRVGDGQIAQADMYQGAG